MLKLWWAFLKIGFLGFGGGYAMLSLIFQESRSLGLSVGQFADLNALDGMIPGPIAINSATYIGQLTYGIPGALVATLAVAVPSFVWVPLYLHFESQIKNNRWLSGILNGIKPASVGLILAVALSLFLTTVFGIPNLAHLAKAHIDWVSILVIAVVLLLDMKWHANPVISVLVAAAIGAVCYYL